MRGTRWGLVIAIVTLGTWACGSDEDNAAAGGPDGGAGTNAGGTNTGGSSGNSGSSASGGSGGTSGSSGNAGDGGSSGTGSDAGGSGSGSRFSCASQPGPGTVIEPGSAGTADVTLSVRSDRAVHAISPLIYGMNGVSSTSETRDRPTLTRSGGNRMTAYNWETNASNAGSDYLFQNDSLLGDTEVPGEAVRGTIEFAERTGGAAVVTVPIVDYVAADKDGGGDVRNSGADYLSTRFHQNRDDKAAALSLTPDAADDFVYQDEFVNWVESTAAGANIIFSLDNEPDLWSYTHAEVHPDPVTYAELVERNTRYGAAVKRVWPEAETLGFVSYGWYGYESLQGAPDAAGRNFIEYYLDQMKAAEAAHGSRLVDYLDLHWYPEAQGGGVRVTEQDTSAAVVAARVQAPRSLWDDSYVEDSWITSSLGDQPIRLIPLMRERIAAHYPGTNLAFTEWNYGGGGHISGAVAAADVLGIFGRECVALAALWRLSDDESFIMAAFQVFRNYDGSGAAFGDTSISAESSAVDQATVYASIDSADPARVVIVAINKQSTARTAALTVAHPTAFSKADVFTVTSAGASPEPATALTAVATNAFRYQMPAMSVSVIVPKP